MLIKIKCFCSLVKINKLKGKKSRRVSSRQGSKMLKEVIMVKACS